MDEPAKLNCRVIDISPTGEGYFPRPLPDGTPSPFVGWRMYRLEYGGCNEDCLYEGRVLLPPRMDPQSVCNLIMGAQAHEHTWVEE